MRPAVFRSLVLCAVLGVAIAGAAGAVAVRQSATYTDPADTRAAMRAALQARADAEVRSRRLDAEAAKAGTAAERTAREAAALAARVQQAEAGIAAATARISLVERERQALRERLGRQQQPLVRLTAALQQFARRPAALSLLRSGSVEDLVHTRALLAAAAPQVETRTARVRAELARLRKLGDQSREALAVLRAEEGRLSERRQQLATLEARQRMASRQARGQADRESERVLALAEQARDLGSLVGELERAGSLRAQLAALPGPMPRPDNPAAAPAAGSALQDAEPRQPGAPRPFVLPVTGRLVAGFGVPTDAGQSRGITLAPAPGAQIVAPAAGRVAFAGPFRGYGRIVIIEHPGGWTSLVTGLDRTGVEVGQALVGGSPLGVAQQAGPVVTVELRKGTEPVDPLPLVD